MPHLVPLAHAAQRRRFGCAAALLLLALSACAPLPRAVDTSDAGAPSGPAGSPEATCVAWAARLDEAVSRAGVGDAEAARIPGQPFLRVDRIGQALRPAAVPGTPGWTAWLARAAALDAAGRRAEITNLPASAFPIGDVASADAAQARAEACRDNARRQADAWRGAPLTWLAGATVPDRYVDWQRALGVYPLLRHPFFAGVSRWQDEHRAQMARWQTAPPEREAWFPPQPLGGPPAAPRRDALGLPIASGDDAAAWLAWHAPVVEIEARGPGDRWGMPVWASQGRPDVDPSRPVVFGRVEAARLGGTWWRQLVYTLWFGERAATSAFDPLAGALDGVIIRLTLDDDGRPWLVDSIHACGCYHLFFASPRLRARPGAPDDEEWAFQPAPWPAGDDRQRLVVRLSSHEHQLSGLAWVPRDATTGRGYALAPEEMLRTLPVPGGTRSLYGPDGLVPGTQRGERWLFWPMGIPSAGAMRQWGHHATAFVGRRHFDDVDLIEARFEPVDAPAPSPRAALSTRSPP